jgi:serine/threonine protein kinase
MDHGPDDTTELSAVDGMLAQVLEHPREARAAALEDVCLRYPSHADELRSRYRVLQAIGMLDAPTTPPETFPSQLGDFRLVQPLGGGGMGIVYRAVEEPLGREVALKLIRPDNLYFPGARAWFQREIEAIASLQHPGIVPIYRVGEAEGMRFFAMELVPGASLAHAIGRVRRVPQERLVAADLAQAVGGSDGRTLAGPFALGGWVDASVAVVLQVAEALAHAHARGVVHRDIKPSNIMLTPDGRARLLDFGLASRSGATKLTRTGATMGSLAYMSPEQVRGERVDARSDVYSLGVTLYEMLTLHEPFVDETSEGLRGQILRGQPKPIRMLNRRVAWDVETVCQHAMAPEVHRRYASMAEFGADLRRLMLREPIVARRPGVWLRTRRLVQRHPTASAAATLGLLLCTALPTALWWQQRAANQQIRMALSRAETEAETARRSIDFLVSSVELANPERGLGEVLTVRQMADVASKRYATELSGLPRVQGSLMAALGRVYRAIGSYDVAVRVLSDALPLLDAARSPEAATARVELARVHRALGQIEPAEAMLAILRADAGSWSPAVAAAVAVESARLLHDRGAREAAYAMLAAAESTCRQARDDNGLLDVLRARVHLLVYGSGYREALARLDEVAALARRLRGDDAAVLAELQLYRARALRAAAEPQQAALAFAAAEATVRRVFGADSLQQADVLEAFALAAADLQPTKVDAAVRAVIPEGGSRELLTTALDIRRRKLPPGHPAIARSLTLIGELDLNQARYADALAAYGEARSIIERQPMLDRRMLASVIGQCAMAAFATGDQTALAQADRAAALYVELKDESESYAEFLARHSVMLHVAGQAARAFEVSTQALALRRKLHPPGHEAIAGSLTTLVTLASELDKLELALSYADEVVNLRIGDRADSAANGAALLGRGMILTRMNRPDDAADAMQRGMELMRKHQGEHYNTVVAANNCGAAYHKMRRYREANDAYGEALTLAAKVLAPDDPLQQSLRWRAASTCLASKDYERAIALCEAGLALTGPRTSESDVAELRRICDLARTGLASKGR